MDICFQIPTNNNQSCLCGGACNHVTFPDDSDLETDEDYEEV